MLDRAEAAELFDTCWYRRRYKDVGAADPFAHYLSVGAAEARDPSPLFSTAWYVAHNPGVEPGDALRHYVQVGAARRRDPSPLFDSAWYFARYPEADVPGSDARSHYMEAGARAGYDPNPLFRTSWYLQNYPAVAGSGQNALLHYLREGAALGYDPSIFFSTTHYLSQHLELAASGDNPLLHYLTHHAIDRESFSAWDHSVSLGSRNAAAAMLRRISDIDPDASRVPARLETVPCLAYDLDPASLAWRRLYLSLDRPPETLLLIGSLDDADALAALPVDQTWLLLETDTATAGHGIGLPPGTQWRSLAEFGSELGAEDRIRLVAAAVNLLQPAVTLVSGSEAGWEALARHGRALRQRTVLLGTDAPLSTSRADEVSRRYFRSCIPFLTAWLARDAPTLHTLAQRFGLPASGEAKLHDVASLPALLQACSGRERVP